MNELTCGNQPECEEICCVAVLRHTKLSQRRSADVAVQSARIGENININIKMNMNMDMDMNMNIDNNINCCWRATR